MTMKKHLLALSLIFLVAYILPLGFRPLVDPDETRYAEIPREMNASGDYVVPRLNGVLYFEKPVMGYWLNAFSMNVFGENNFAVRLPQALAVGFSALCIFFLAARSGGGVSSGFLCALIYMSCLQVFAIGVFNTLDSLLCFFLTGSLTFFYLAWDKRESRKAYYGFLALAGLFCGLACHTKGFLAFAVPVSVIVPFVIWEGRWKEMFKIPWIPVGVAVLVMLPWGILIHLREPDFWNYFFWHEHVSRFLSGASQHKEPFYFFIPVLLGGIFPHTVLLPAAFSGLKIKGFDSSFSRFLLCWFLFPFLFFSASSGKLETYILPCFPPLAILIGLGLSAYLSADRKSLFSGGVRVMMFFPVLAVIAVFALQNGVSHKMDYLFSDLWKIGVFLVAMAGFGLLLRAAHKAGKPFKSIMFFALSPMLFYAAAHVLTPDKALRRNSPNLFIDQNLSLIKKDAIVVSPSTPIKAVCWSLKRNDIFLLDGGGELSYGFGQKGMAHRQLTFETFGLMVSANKTGRQIVLILDERRYTRWKEQLPQPATMVNNGEDGFIMAFF